MKTGARVLAATLRARVIAPWRNLFGVMTFAIAPLCAFAQTPVPPVSNPCARFTAGSAVQQPPALFSQNGVLNVRFSYQTTIDAAGRQLYCFMTPDGLENPTLHVNPGDTLNITVTNNTPTSPVSTMGEIDEPYNPPNCGDTTQQTQDPTQNNGMTGGSMNIHYHGTNTSPACHEDNVVKTLINSNHTFQYSVHFPTDEPPGLYWYHPHVHGLAEAAVLGGAAGALIVDGIQNVQPAVAELREQILVIRDQPTLQGLTQSPGGTEGGIPQHDLSVNFVPLDTTTTPAQPYPQGVTTYTPAIIQMGAGEQQFWRICNCTSDAPLDLQVRFDGVAQTIQLVGIDAVPVNSQDGTQPGQLIPATHFRIPPASRVEFIVKAPPSTVKLAQLVAQLIKSGPLGDDLPTRPLLTMQTVADGEVAGGKVPAFTGQNNSLQRFAGIASEPVARTRLVYFDELQDGTAFFINAVSCTPESETVCEPQPYPVDTVFDNNRLPAIVTIQGSVEKWIIQNRARENHEFHQHQIHFEVLSQDNFDQNNEAQPAPGINGQFLDMIEVPFCNNPPRPTRANPSPPFPACTAPFPQVQLLMDFRGPDIGDFVFHCHILGHEDLGMMAIERVIPKED
jgi:FtsP/CotA-like multicopper oxidase with cupredoxin domain